MNTKSNEKSSETQVPPDLRKAMASAPKSKTKWADLTPIARRDFISWIESAKQRETRKRRVERACDMLVSGKRRPCCYAIVPMGLYKALADAPKAQAKWKELTPDARRDLVGWIDEAKELAARQRRIEKVCAMLAAGKRRP